jgi:Protein of unknown function (DUF1292).
MENMNREELDIITLEDDGGNEIVMQVIDYIFYEGHEYAILTEVVEDLDEDAPLNALVMEVCGVEGEEDMEEFVPIDEALGQRIIDLYNEDLLEGDDEDEE